MNVYVIGAGVSKTAGYPLGAELLAEVDTCVRNLQPVSNAAIEGSDRSKEWPKLCEWLDQNPNPLIKEAYRIRHFEYLFTVLDSASALLRYGSNEMAVKQGRWKPARFVTVDASHKPYFLAATDYIHANNLLQWALSAYLYCKHHEDFLGPNDFRWRRLEAFARRLRRGDVVITFNYDSTLERVLFMLSQWTPDDGYGFKVRLQESWTDSTPVSCGPSAVTTLHLHGALGWYNKSSVDRFYLGEAEERVENLTPEIIEEPVSLDQDFLAGLGIRALDPSVYSQPYEFQVLLHPSYLKAFGPPAVRAVFLNLWRRAAQALRAADKIIVIGYSLPEADSAALTLLLTNSDSQRLQIVNSNKVDAIRLRRLLTKDWLNDTAQSFDDWLSQDPDHP